MESSNVLKPALPTCPRDLEPVPFPAWIYDLATRTILDVNEAAIREYGYSRTEFLNMSVLEIRSLAELPDFIHNHEGTIEKGGPVRERQRHRRFDGSEFETETTIYDVLSRGRLSCLLLSKPMQKLEERPLPRNAADISAFREVCSPQLRKKAN